MAFSPADSPYIGLPNVALLVLLDEKDQLLAAQGRQLAAKDMLLAKANGELLELATQFKKVQHILNLRNKKIFGSTSEKLEAIVPEQSREGYIAFEETDGGGQAQTDVSNEKPKRKYSIPHPGRTPLPDYLERRDTHLYPEGYEAGVDIELPPLTTERLAIDLVVYVERMIRHKSVRSGKLVVALFPVDDPCFRCKFSLSLVTHMLMLRFVHHMPYYRIIQLLPSGIIGYNTLIGAAGWAFDLLAPLAPVLLAEVKMGAERLNIDETTYDGLDSPENMALFKRQGKVVVEASEEPEQIGQVAKSKVATHATTTETTTEQKAEVAEKKKVIHTGRVWVLGNEQAGLVYYEFTATRAACIAERLLEGHSGLLMSDAYTAYISIAGQQDSKITLTLCWAHARRRFADLIEKGNRKTDPVVLEVIRRIGELYQIEKVIKGKSDAEKLAGRTGSAELLVSLKAYLDEKVLLYTPKEDVTEAINYLLNHWGHFIEYVNHAAGSMDNNYVERAVKPLTLNRKNSMFFGSIKQSAGAALMFSLFEVCKNHEVNYLHWLTDVLKRIKTHPKDQLQELLPHKWVPKDP